MIADLARGECINGARVGERCRRFPVAGDVGAGALQPNVAAPGDGVRAADRQVASRIDTDHAVIGSRSRATVLPKVDRAGRRPNRTRGRRARYYRPAGLIVHVRDYHQGCAVFGHERPGVDDRIGAGVDRQRIAGAGGAGCPGIVECQVIGRLDAHVADLAGGPERLDRACIGERRRCASRRW